VKRVAEYITGDASYDRTKLDQLAKEQVLVFTLRADERRARACKAYTTVAGQRVLKEDPRPYYDVGFEFTEFDYLVSAGWTELYGSKWRLPDRRSRLPLVATYIDFEGSKLGLEAPPLHELHFYHFHGLFVFPPEKVERARMLLPSILRALPARNGLLFDSAVIEPFDPARHHEDAEDKVIAPAARSALENWIQYSTKGVAHLSVKHDWPGELYRIYPNPNGLTYNYPRPNIGSPDRRVPFEHLNTEPYAERTA
jgi:hypothetical protein